MDVFHFFQESPPGNIKKKSSYRCLASEGATRRSCIWMILKGGRDDLFSWKFWRNYVSISGFYDPEVVTRRPFFRLFYRDYEIILGFDYFEWVSEWFRVLRTLKESKTKLFCSWTDLADFFYPISHTGCRCEISGQRTPARPAVKIETLKQLDWV